ncbi:MAG: hypothetical protein H0W62_04745 [Chitinophagales bacterium]|nr:hypothetical protein [Chitinophagales bacterium]
MKFFFITVILYSTVIFSSCKKDNSSTIIPSDYPADVAKIVDTKCSVTGCHNTASKLGAGSLDMSTWTHLFEGGSGGSVVIPYRSDESYVMFFVNTDSTRGISLKPTMPYLRPPLSDDEYNTLKNWIDAGAPNSEGTVAFSDDPNRKKFYVANQGCDEVTVFDSKTLLAMRYIKVGISDNIETPHQIRVSPDGQYWYVIFVASTVMQKFRTSDDTHVGDIDIGVGSWNTMCFSADSKYAFAVDWEDQGKVVYVDLENMKVLKTYSGSDLFSWPHGSAVNSSFTTLYVTSQYGNYINKIDITDPLFPDVQKTVIKPGQQPNTIPNTYDPHEILLSPDESKYFVTCQASNEVRVMDAATDTLIKVIPVGTYPLEMSVSKVHPYLFVTCMQDPCGQPACRGSVYVLDYNTLEVVKVLQSELFQPHGVAVDDENEKVYISNRNIDPNGPPPHHTSECGGKNGFIRIIDMNLLEFLPGYRTEVSVDPYSVTSN